MRRASPSARQRGRFQSKPGREERDLDSWPTVVTLRCTRKLLVRLGAANRREGEASVPTTRLGDWHGNLLYRPGGQLVLLVNDRSLLPVLIAARPAETIVPRFVEALGALLRRLDVRAEVVSAELAKMGEIRIGSTANRRILGSMTDFAWMLDSYLTPGGSLEDAALRLAEAPCGPIGMQSPDDVAPRLLSSAE